MNSPAVYLGFLIASLIGLLFHAVRGGSLGRLLLYVVTAWIAFFLGHSLAGLMGWEAGRLGGINLLPAVVATVVGLLVASLLAGPRERKAPPPRPS
jgi:ABC-type transport system involved in cytochrome c biogenesis permease subunit